MDNGIVIDSSNFHYLVTREHLGYSVSYSYGIPRKSKKGYLGHKLMSDRIRIKNQEGAQQLFANWKEEFLSKFLRKEIVRLYLSYYPMYDYYVKCPRCGGQAEILDWLMCSWYQGEDCTFGSPIACRHCASNLREKLDWIHNEVGWCVYLDKESEEPELQLNREYHTGGIKWEDYLANPNILEKYE
jgi:hypothetical protein